MSVTKVGPPERSDFPRKKGVLHRIGRFFYVITGMSWLLSVAWFIPARRIPEVTRLTLGEDDIESTKKATDHGIPEADLPDWKRQQAMKRMDWLDE